MESELPTYGQWTLVLTNAAIFIFFAFSFFKPETRRDWHVLCGYSVFVVALFVEMYGFPLTLHLLSSWHGQPLAGADHAAHGAGHLWYALLGVEANPSVAPMYLASDVIIFAGHILIAWSWHARHAAPQERAVAPRGPYRHVRHPRYLGLVMIIVGFSLQWPTLVTAVLCPALAIAYVRRGRCEERELAARLGDVWRTYAAVTPGWLPRLASRAPGRLPHLR